MTISDEYLPLDRAIARLGPALVGVDWIFKLTDRERFLIGENSDALPGGIRRAAPGGDEMAAAIGRRDAMLSQRDDVKERLRSLDLLFEAADGTLCVAAADFQAEYDRLVSRRVSRASPPIRPVRAGRAPASEKLEAVAAPDDAQSAKRSFPKMAIPLLEAGTVRGGHGSVATLAQILAEGTPYSPKTIERYIRDDVRKWESQNPDFRIPNPENLPESSGK